jgi:hypothetical protein
MCSEESRVCDLQERNCHPGTSMKHDSRVGFGRFGPVM